MVYIYINNHKLTLLINILVDLTYMVRIEFVNMDEVNNYYQYIFEIKSPNYPFGTL